MSSRSSAWLHFSHIDSTRPVIFSYSEAATRHWLSHAPTNSKNNYWIFFHSSRAWLEVCETFTVLPYAAVVDEKILCVHGGLSPSCSHLTKSTAFRVLSTPQTASFPAICYGLIPSTCMRGGLRTSVEAASVSAAMLW